MYVLLRQAATIILDDLGEHVEDLASICKTAHEKLARELGRHLYSEDDDVKGCMRVVCDQYDLWKGSHGNPEEFLMHRMSLVELLFAMIEAEIRKPVAPSSRNFFWFKKAESLATKNLSITAMQDAVDELNQRALTAKLPFDYHNGLFQRTSDDATQNQVHEPFWKLVGGQKWRNIDTDMKEAIDRHDQNGRDVALYALKALESTIKIVSDERGFSRGNERGAANYIDNLVSEKNGRFIQVWESEQLKALFRDIRNPHGHGPGSKPQPKLSIEQEKWVIESAMIWIKSLVCRM